ncbi:MAG: hypothetical protein WBV81_19820, partial [Ignavibacteriaceae bacterium]
YKPALYSGFSFKEGVDMKKILLFCSSFFIMAAFLPAQSIGINPYLSGGINFGYNSGMGVQGNLTVSNFAQDFPVSFRLGVEYTSVNPGNPVDARVIFINDATNGVPQKSGYVWDFRMDFLFRIKIFSLPKSFFFIGPRYSQFTADFEFIDGNEFFTINSNQWGLGTGIQSNFLLTRRLDLVLTTGFDYYFSSVIEGHDTSYGSDGTIINGRKNFTYTDADNAINQPKFVIKAMMGFNYYF